MNADASTTRTRCRSSSSTVVRSIDSSLGLWIRLQANASPEISTARRRSAASIRSGSRPAAPNELRYPARARAMTSSSEAMPLAIAPVM